MPLLNKIQFYKRMIHALVVINLVVISSGLFSTFTYYSSKAALITLVRQDIGRLRHLDQVEGALFTALTDVGNEKDDYRRRRNLERLTETLGSWPDSNLGTLTLTTGPGVSLQSVSLPIAFAKDLNRRVLAERTRLQEEISQANEKIGDVTVQLVLVTGLTILLGFVLPAWIFRRLLREITKARHDLEKRVSHWMIEWAESYRRHGDKPFQDVLFWIEILTLSFETFAPRSNQPLFFFLSEIAPVLRAEIQKQKDRDPARAT